MMSAVLIFIQYLKNYCYYYYYYYYYKILWNTEIIYKINLTLQEIKESMQLK